MRRFFGKLCRLRMESSHKHTKEEDDDDDDDFDDDEEMLHK